MWPKISTVIVLGIFHVVVRLRLMPEFIAADERKPVFDELLNTLPWQQETVVDGDETFLQPRMTAWIGEHPYSYAGITHPPNEEVNGPNAMFAT